MGKFLELRIYKLKNGNYYFDYKYDNTGFWEKSDTETVTKGNAETKLLQLFELAMKGKNEY